ncbi:hypothetical protein SMAC4_13849 [Sordaria macrospora]|uniref:uncharacterized protein n=1 Tax=Sordaria macrospora TaxID=5147 RepID=UPI002B2AD3DE|nr:hypothetical protein SMAC4_13849 [Sordaria macrospora]
MSEDARSLGTLAAAVAPDYMQSAAAAPSEALRSSNAGSWTGMTGCKQGRQQILRLQDTQTLFCEFRRHVLQFRKLHSACFQVYLYSGQILDVFFIFTGRQVHGSQAAEGIPYSRKSPQCNTH